MATSPTAVPNTGGGSLYVFLHGMICLVQTPTQFLGLVVDMGEDHSYRMGDWLTETPFERGEVFSLQGVTPGTAALDDSKITVVERPLFPSPHVFATLTLPTPKAVHSLRRTPIAFSNLSGGSLSTLNQPAPNSCVIAALQVLEYDYPDIKAVSMAPSLWAPTSVGGVATLHFFAEPEVPTPDGHEADEFQKTASLFADLDLSTNGAFRIAPLETTEYPGTLPVGEAMGLVERQKLLRGFALSMKRNTPGVLPAPDVTGGDVLCAPFAARVH
jgi:hypothetical protein